MYIVVLLMIVFAAILSGCVEEKEQIISDKTNISNNSMINSSAYKTDIKQVSEGEHWYDRTTKTIVTGKIIEIRFRSDSADILVFEDNTIVSAFNAENFVFQIGKIHTVRIVSNINGYDIVKVNISPEDT